MAILPFVTSNPARVIFLFKPAQKPGLRFVRIVCTIAQLFCRSNSFFVFRDFFREVVGFDEYLFRFEIVFVLFHEWPENGAFSPDFPHFLSGNIHFSSKKTMRNGICRQPPHGFIFSASCIKFVFSPTRGLRKTICFHGVNIFATGHIFSCKARSKQHFRAKGNPVDAVCKTAPTISASTPNGSAPNGAATSERCGTVDNAVFDFQFPFYIILYPRAGRIRRPGRLW